MEIKRGLNMYIITSKEFKTVLGICDELDYMKNGYPRMVQENIAFPKEMVDIYENIIVPDDVEPNKNCYSPADGFYINPNWTEPKPSADERIGLLEAEVVELKAQNEALLKGIMNTGGAV